MLHFLALLSLILLLLPNCAIGFTSGFPTPARTNYFVGLSQDTTALDAKKKGQSNAPASKGKVQVKLLKHIAGTGQAGQVIMVTPAFFNNKLRPTQSAKLISDDEVTKERIQAEGLQNEMKAKAEQLKEHISRLTLTLPRKSGPDGQLFGGINVKAIVSELESVVQDDYLKQKGVKVTEIYGEDGKKIRGDIKHTGQFFARIVLLKDVSVKFEIIVEAED